MTDTTAAATRFALDEDTALAWLAAAVEADGVFLAHLNADNTLPDITAQWAPAVDDGEGNGEIFNTVRAAQDRGIITCPGRARIVFTLDRDSDGASYRWLVTTGTSPGPDITLATDPEDLHHLGDGRDATGAAAGLAVLREAVQAANRCLDGLRAHIAATSPEPDDLTCSTADQQADSAALDQIQHILRNPVYGPGMLEDIAGIVGGTGRPTANLPGNEQTWIPH